MTAETTCHRCGYEWEYGGEKDMYATCPNCKTSTKLGGSEGGSRDADEPVVVETEMWGEQSLDEFAETVSEMLVRPTDFGAASEDEVERLQKQVDAQAEIIEDQREQIAELYAAFDDLSEQRGWSIEWDHEPPYDPTEEFGE